MNYKEFFEYIEKNIEDRLKYSVMTDRVHSSSPSDCSLGTDSESGNEVSGSQYIAVTNAGYNTLNSWRNKFIADGEYFYPYNQIPIITATLSGSSFILNSNGTYTDACSKYGTMFKAMYYAVIGLFIELEVDEPDYRYQDTNYTIINSFGDASRTLEDYNTSTQEFFERGEYWFIRGHLYEFLADVENDLYKKYMNNLNELFSYIDAKQAEYESITGKRYASTTSCSELSPSRVTSTAETFWNRYHSEFVTKVNNAFTPIRNDVNTIHRELIGIISLYLFYYNQLSEWLSKGDCFITALQKTSTSPGLCLADTFSRLRDGGVFNNYSRGSMDVMYGLFEQAKVMRDESKYASEDDHNLYLRKYLTYKVLEHFNFFNNAVFLQRRIESLRTIVN